VIDCFGLQRWRRAETQTARSKLFKTFILIDLLYTKMLATFVLAFRDPGLHTWKASFALTASVETDLTCVF